MALVPFSQDSPVVLQQMPSLVSETTEIESKNTLSFLVFAFSTSGPIFLMWIRPKAYVATLLARGNPKNTLTVSWSLQS